jgi:hypothetical protein
MIRLVEAGLVRAVVWFWSTLSRGIRIWGDEFREFVGIRIGDAPWGPVAS